ncbi:MAG: hypothetical protein QOD56_361 [Gammaproteobacteria bacterium]|jgi:hypothetical protein|nr:hypothetical protein [Gammaproteobacteria bacterium]MEA3161511.1 hypothetical protein [Gammaproteobacteria bacterium]
MKMIYGRWVDEEVAATDLTAAPLACLLLAHAEIVFTQKNRCISVEG